MATVMAMPVPVPGQSILLLAPCLTTHHYLGRFFPPGISVSNIILYRQVASYTTIIIVVVVTVVVMSRYWTIVLLVSLATTTSAFLPYGYSVQSSLPSDDMNNSVLRTYRRCMWEQSKFLPRRLVLLSLCSNLFCENNQLVPRSRSMFVVEKVARPNDCLDMLPDQCIQGDEDDLMYKPFPDCCPVYCNLKRRLNRLKSLLFRHRVLSSPSQSVVLNDLS